jgi:predicted nucleotidyltransferase
VRDPLEGVAGDGSIRTGADRSRVPAVYEPVVEALATAFTDCRAAEAFSGPCSLLLYGSVATGQAVPPGSDVDAVLLGASPQAAAAVAEELSRRFAGVCREVAVSAPQVRDHEADDDEGYGNRVFLRHYCAVLAGDDVAARWPPFPADDRAARGFNGDIAQHLERWRATSHAQPQLQPARAAVLGRSLARKTLLATAGLVSVHDATWTTDRATGAQRWGQVDPAAAEGLRELLAWAQGANTASVSDVHRVLRDGGTVQRAADAFRDLVGLWRVS